MGKEENEKATQVILELFKTETGTREFCKVAARILKLNEEKLFNRMMEK